MKSFWDQTNVEEGQMRLYVSHPEGAGPFPGVVVIQHQGGVDAFIEEITQRIAEAGYFGVAPELYHRDPPDCNDDSPTRRGRLRDVTVIKDVNAAVDYLRGQKSVDKERFAIIGFCMGGRVAYLMASAIPSFRAAVDYYGGNAFRPWGDGPSPFERTAEIHCPVLGQFGGKDKNPSPDDVRKLGVELTRLGKVHEFYSYPNADHGFMRKTSEAYHPESAEASWPRTLDFFRRFLVGEMPKRAASER